MKKFHANFGTEFTKGVLAPKPFLNLPNIIFNKDTNKQLLLRNTFGPDFYAELQKRYSRKNKILLDEGDE